jgi:flagellin
MGFTINGNVGLMNASLQSNANEVALNKSLEALASATQGFSSSFGISDQLSAQVSGLGQAIQNSNESIGLVQVTDGALQEYGNILQDVRVLTLQASNGTLSSGDREIIQQQIDSLMESADDIAKTTSFNGIKLLDGTGGSLGDVTFVTQTGADAGDTQSFQIGDAQTDSVLSAPTDVTTQAGAFASLDTIDAAMGTIDSMRADLGAAQNQLMSNINNISVTRINVAAAESQMSDVDFALESANFSKQSILSQTGSWAQAQANASQANVVNLF